jgi:hypothetical protein
MPATRRTIAETLTADQTAFLRQPEQQTGAPTESAARPVTKKRSRPPRLPKTSSDQSSRPRRSQREPLRSVTLRLPASLAETLRRVSMQRSLHYIEPFSQQAIVEAALRLWLRREKQQR